MIKIGNTASSKKTLTKSGLKNPTALRDAARRYGELSAGPDEIRNKKIPETHKR